MMNLVPEKLSYEELVLKSPKLLSQARYKNPYVVYFDQCLGAAHSKRWSK